MIMYDGDGYKWIDVEPVDGDGISPEVHSILADLVYQINDLGYELAQLKNEVEK